MPILARSSDRIAHARALVVMGRVSARLGHLEDARVSFSQAVSLLTAPRSDIGGMMRRSAGLLRVSDGFSEQGQSLLQQAWQDARTRQDRDQELSAIVALGMDTGCWIRQPTPAGITRTASI